MKEVPHCDSSPKEVSTLPHSVCSGQTQVVIPDGLLTPNMRMLNDRFGFDTMLARQTCANLAQVPAGSRVLDVGTSSGWMAFVLSAAANQVVAIDVDLDGLQRARDLATQIGEQVAKKVAIVAANALALPFEENTFDGVFSFESLHHFPNCSLAVNEMYRVCREGGVVAIADLNARGRLAVRETMQLLTGQAHEENPCRLLALQHLCERFGECERYDIPFLGVFAVRKIASMRTQ